MQKEDYMIKERIQLYNFTKKWIQNKVKLNASSKKESTLFQTVQIHLKEKGLVKVSKTTMIFLQIFKKISL